ncbi:MAG: SBBP repeat-containing protein [Candidatus Kapabacteria bacterium]|nr:SBBP repeat-containing protein [Candidatus Kapabacteria bacterium]
MKKTITIFIFAFISLSNLVNAQAPNCLWAKKAGGTTEDVSNSVTTDASGNVYVTGYFTSPTITFGTTTITNTGGYDIFIVKYDAAGTVLWAKSAGGTDSDYGSSLTTDASGNVYVTGRFVSPTITFGTTTLTNPGGYDIFIVKYDAAGTVLWAKSAGGTSDDHGRSVSTDASGNVYVTGYFTSPTITFGTTTLTNAGENDIFIAKYAGTGTGVDESSNSDIFSVFPNPAQSLINVKADIKLLGSSYVVYDNTGKTILKGIITSEDTIIELGNLSGGIYFFSVGENLKQSFKVIKNKTSP